MVVKICAACGSGFESKAANAKRCPSCRAGKSESVSSAVRATLRSVGGENTPLGAAAVVLAARLDAGVDPGSAMAAMAKELRATMVELARRAPAAADPVDELKRRRKARLGA